MACSACSRRKPTGRILPVNPNKHKAERTERTERTEGAKAPNPRGSSLISKLRFTGR